MPTCSSKYIKTSSVGEAWGQQGPTGEGASELVALASLDPEVILVQ